VLGIFCYVERLGNLTAGIFRISEYLLTPQD